MKDLLSIQPRDRLLLIVAHPDDETIAAGGLLRRATDAGASIRILYATGGDNNAWMQRLLERRWTIGAEDRIRYARIRRTELRNALAVLGVKEENARFLNYPDQGLTDLLLHNPAEVLDALFAELTDWQPTILVAPSRGDLHPDHNALAVLTDLCLDRFDAEATAPSVFRYIVHGKTSATSETGAVGLSLTPTEVHGKRNALACHETQALFRRKWFLAFARETEWFCMEHAEQDIFSSHPVREAVLGANTLWLDLARQSRIRRPFGARQVQIVCKNRKREVQRLSIDFARNSEEAEVRSTGSGQIMGKGRASRRRDGVFLQLPLEIFGDAEHAFVKCARRQGFFDDAGWLKIILKQRPPSPRSEEPAIALGEAAHPVVCAVIPCFNTASSCAAIVKKAVQYADYVIAVDDGSTDDTRRVLQTLARSDPKRFLMICNDENKGKGAALMTAFRHALDFVPFDVLVTLDSDGQHRPKDIPLLVQAWREGAEFVVGERRSTRIMPLRSRFGNAAARILLRWLFPGCPFDTQSGLRAMDHQFLQTVLGHVQGHRYETEFQILLLALDQRLRIKTVTVPTIYLNKNRSSHYRPLLDSLRIGFTLTRWMLRSSERQADGAESYAE